MYKFSIDYKNGTSSNFSQISDTDLERRQDTEKHDD